MPYTETLKTNERIVPVKISSERTIYLLYRLGEDGFWHSIMNNETMDDIQKLVLEIAND